MTNNGASETPYSDALGLTTPATFQQLIRARRLGLGWSLPQAAEQIGASRETVCNWERPGSRGQLPAPAKVPAIAAAYGLELAELATLLDAAALERANR
jgi:transcriptional regulator with XRE-family HTH domain